MALAAALRSAAAEKCTRTVSDSFCRPVSGVQVLERVRGVVVDERSSSRPMSSGSDVERRTSKAGRRSAKNISNAVEEGTFVRVLPTARLGRLLGHRLVQLLDSSPSARGTASSAPRVGPPRTGHRDPGRKDGASPCPVLETSCPVGCPLARRRPRALRASAPESYPQGSGSGTTPALDTRGRRRLGGRMDDLRLTRRRIGLQADRPLTHARPRLAGAVAGRWQYRPES